MNAEKYDVLIVGAGISGVGAACHLKRLCPDRTFAILEGRADSGGTWDLFRYPGVRSDSDMHTLGYSFKPWIGEKSIADGPSILGYLRETIAENDLERHIHYNQLVTRAQWSSADAAWTVSTSSPSAEHTFRCGFLFMCSGYYSYKAGYEPDFPGRERFRGEVVHPQKWPDDLDYAGKTVVVIGSGATAVTLVPAMAEHARHVTMLQRSPTYMASGPSVDRINAVLKRLLPARLAYALTRRKNTVLGDLIYRRVRRRPAWAKKKLRQNVEKHLDAGHDIDTHFTPTYDPWDQRLCLVPDADLFNALNDGRASVATDTITTFTESGIELESGGHLDADIIVTATGLQLVTLGEAEFEVDGAAVDFSATWTYKGLAYSDIPNLASSFGYVNASWTLRADLTCKYVCRLLNHMAATGTDMCTPRLRPADAAMTRRPFIDGFTAGYMQRMFPLLPKQGDVAPWVNPQRYPADRKLLGRGALDDGVMRFERAAPTAAAAGGPDMSTPARSAQTPTCDAAWPRDPS